MTTAIEYWSTMEGAWKKEGVYIDKEHAEQNLLILREKSPQSRYRIAPEDGGQDEARDGQ